MLMAGPSGQSAEMMWTSYLINQGANVRSLILIAVVWISSTVGTAQITGGTSALPVVLLPRFAEFKIASTFNGRPVAAVLVRPEERRFRSVLLEGATHGPNFAGHYTIVEWGCGSECWQAAIINAETG